VTRRGESVALHALVSKDASENLGVAVSVAIGVYGCAQDRVVDASPSMAESVPGRALTVTLAGSGSDERPPFGRAHGQERLA